MNVRLIKKIMKATMKNRVSTQNLGRKGVLLFVFVIALVINSLAQDPTAVATVAESALDSTSRDSLSAALAAEKARSDMWGYIFAGLGIAGGIAIAWFLAVGASKPAKKPSHAVKKR